MLVGGGGGWQTGDRFGGGLQYFLLMTLCLTPSTITMYMYDASTIVYEYLNDDENSDEYVNINLNTSCFDTQSFINKFKHVNNPIMLSLNIQSLQSKYSELKSFINDLISHGIKVDTLHCKKQGTSNTLTYLTYLVFKN